MFCRSLSVVCILLMCMMLESSSSPLGQRGSLAFPHSLRLTRTIRARVQQLLSRYKKQLFGDELFDNRELMLHTLPVVTVTYQTWLQMQDIDRLQLASHHLQTFWTHLEDQRQQLEKEKDEKRREPRRDKRGRPQVTLCQSFMGLQIDLRDLMKQVNSQLESLISNQGLDSTFTKSPLPSSFYSITSSSPSRHRSTASTTPHSGRTHLTSSYTDVPQSSTTFTVESTQTLTASNTKQSATTEKTSVGVTGIPRLTKPTQTSTVHHSGGRQLYVEKKQRVAPSSESSRWIQHLKGYVILRDLERYLSRLARDYTVLQAKH